MDPEDNGIVATMDDGTIVTVSDCGMVTMTDADGAYTTIDTNDHTVTIEEAAGDIQYYDNTTGDTSTGVTGEDGGSDTGSGGWLY